MVSVFWFLAIILSSSTSTHSSNSTCCLLQKYWDLALIGFVYNLAIWADKFVFWLAPPPTIVVPLTVHDSMKARCFSPT
jgi:uncharacterized membrane protein